MLKILRNRKAQNTAEYAILIALVIGGVVAMQTYAQRALQGRIRSAARDYLGGNTSELGNTGQYEPYYTCTTATTKRDSEDNYNETGSHKISNTVTTEKEDITSKPLDSGE